MQIRKKDIEEELYKIIPNRSMWVVEREINSNFISVGIQNKGVIKHLFWIGSERDLRILRPFVFMELILSKIIRVVCHVNPKK